MHAFMEGIEASCSEATVQRLEQFDSLAPIVTAWLDAATEAWPGITVSPAGFLTHAATKVSNHFGPDLTPEDVAGATRVLAISDLYLAHACLRRDRVALQFLEQRGFGALSSLLHRQGGSSADAEEVLSRLREDVVVGGPSRRPMLERFAGRGDLFSWLRVCALRMLMRHQQERGRERPVGDEVLEVMNAAVSRSPELEPLRKRFRDRFRGMFAQTFSRLDPGDRGLLLQHYVDGLTTGQLGQLLSVHRVTVSRRLVAARKRLLEELRASLTAEFGVSSSECDSILRAFRSQLEFSLMSLAE